MPFPSRDRNASGRGEWREQHQTTTLGVQPTVEESKSPSGSPNLPARDDVNQIVRINPEGKGFHVQDPGGHRKRLLDRPRLQHKPVRQPTIPKILRKRANSAALFDPDHMHLTPAVDA